MKNILWLVNRLKAMSAKEIFWRIQQKSIEKSERNKYKSNPIPVTEIIPENRIKDWILDPNRLGINWDNSEFFLNNKISLFDIYPYEKYRKKWHAGFQTENSWPITFSYDLDCKQRVDIGDVRTNWELNRHFQFVVLAKSFYASGNREYLSEFIELFEEWNKENPFLYGVSWTSPMEIAIRINSWVYSYCFLFKANTKNNGNVPELLFEKLRIGILNMTNYVTKHYSRFSSANNHLIIEAYAIGLVGILVDDKSWKNLSCEIISHEIVLQNYNDGVNKELSIHYQAFVMEAIGLLMHTMRYNQIEIAQEWIEMMEKMSSYISDCMGIYGEVITFGDNDEGKILDLSGESKNYYQYVNDLMGCVLKTRFSDLIDLSENIHWLYTKEEIKTFTEKKKYDNKGSVCYKEGGNTILKSNDRSIIIGIDHAALGFGSIAAHGHADALSFQLFVEGNPIFVDPGTYNYHYMPEERDYFRKTINHNTITINNTNQSEMLGAFLWGSKAETSLLKKEFTDNYDVLIAKHNGYKPINHIRQFNFNKKDTLIIEDYIEEVKKNTDLNITYFLGPNFQIKNFHKNKVQCSDSNINLTLIFESDQKFEIVNKEENYSPRYSLRVPIESIRLNLNVCQNVKIKTSIILG